MRQLTFSRAVLAAVLGCLVTLQAGAFQDRLTVTAVSQLKQGLESEPRQNRLMRLEAFKDFMFKRLNTILPEDVLNIPDEDPRIEEYRSLTEFSGYVNMISPKELSSLTCRGTHRDLINAASTQGSEGTEAVEALKILTSLCK